MPKHKAKDSGEEGALNKEILEKDLAILEEQIRLLDESLKNRVPNRFHDQQPPRVHFDRWLEDHHGNVRERKEPLGVQCS